MKIIPRESRKHLEWNPQQQAPQRPSPAPTNPTQPAPMSKAKFSIDDLVKNGNPKFSEKKDASGTWIGVADSLEQIKEYVGSEGVIASMPYLIAGKANAIKKNYLWKDWFTAYSEENIGIDHDGIFVPAGKPVIITVHGDGILGTPERIMQAYADGLTSQNAAKYVDKDGNSTEEFENLLKGIMPDMLMMNIYTVDDVKNGKIPDPFGRYAVALDFETAKATKSDYLTKDEFMNNPLVLARAGTLEHLENYFDKAQSSGKVGNWHRLNEIDYRQPQGRVLFVGNYQGGLSGNSVLNDDGRFVGVAPEAPGVAKK